MLKPILLSACLAVPAGLALAQNDTGAPSSQDRPQQSPRSAPEMSQQDGHDSGGGHGMEMMMRHHPEMMGRMGGGSKGFVLEMGDDRSLRVSCGDETIAECFEAVRPLIDQLPSLTNAQ